MIKYLQQFNTLYEILNENLRKIIITYIVISVTSTIF